MPISKVEQCSDSNRKHYIKVYNKWGDKQFEERGELVNWSEDKVTVKHSGFIKVFNDMGKQLSIKSA